MSGNGTIKRGPPGIVPNLEAATGPAPGRPRAGGERAVADATLPPAPSAAGTSPTVRALLGIRDPAKPEVAELGTPSRGSAGDAPGIPPPLARPSLAEALGSGRTGLNPLERMALATVSGVVSVKSDAAGRVVSSAGAHDMRLRTPIAAYTEAASKGCQTQFAALHLAKPSDEALQRGRCHAYDPMLGLLTGTARLGDAGLRLADGGRREDCQLQRVGIVLADQMHQAEFVLGDDPANPRSPEETETRIQALLAGRHMAYVHLCAGTTHEAVWPAHGETPERRMPWAEMMDIDPVIQEQIFPGFTAHALEWARAYHAEQGNPEGEAHQAAAQAGLRPYDRADVAALASVLEGYVTPVRAALGGADTARASGIQSLLHARNMRGPSVRLAAGALEDAMAHAGDDVQARLLSDRDAFEEMTQSGPPGPATRRWFSETQKYLNAHGGKRLLRDTVRTGAQRAEAAQTAQEAQVEKAEKEKKSLYEEGATGPRLREATAALGSARETLGERRAATELAVSLSRWAATGEAPSSPDDREPLADLLLRTLEPRKGRLTSWTGPDSDGRKPSPLRLRATQRRAAPTRPKPRTGMTSSRGLPRTAKELAWLAAVDEALNSEHPGTRDPVSRQYREASYMRAWVEQALEKGILPETDRAEAARLLGAFPKAKIAEETLTDRRPDLTAWAAGARALHAVCRDGLPGNAPDFPAEGKLPAVAAGVDVPRAGLEAALLKHGVVTPKKKGPAHLLNVGERRTLRLADAAVADAAIRDAFQRVRARTV